jgi:DNA-binding MarR family transcriptional regulator
MLILHNGPVDADDLGYVIKRAQQALRNAIDPALSDLGLTTAQYATLYNLRRHPGASSAELARLSFVTPQTMVRIVSGLERAGLVRRAPSPAHRRVLQARLTSKGTSALRLAQQRVDAIHAHMLHGIPPAETARLLGWLTRIAVTLEESHPGSHEPGEHRQRGDPP